VSFRQSLTAVAKSAGPHPTYQDFVDTLNTRIENAHKVRKKTSVFDYVAIICTTGGTNR